MIDKIGPERPLPYNNQEFSSADEYLDSLLEFVGKDALLKTLCGGVHILDFFTADPDLYSQVLPQEWRDFFSSHEIMDLLDLFMREDLSQFSGPESKSWRDGPPPPSSLLEYLQAVRKHLLDRTPNCLSSQCTINRTQKKLSRHVSVGMTVKKVHEVGLMAAYIDSLASTISTTTGQKVTHLVDFGSGQNYLGRALASQPYNRHVVAIESKAHNSEKAKDFDVKAKLVKKVRVMRNKKLFRAGVEEDGVEVAPSPAPTAKNGFGSHWEVEGQGSVRYLDRRIEGGELMDVIDDIEDGNESKRVVEPSMMVMSLHSCGNLVHHGLRSLILNPEVKAVAMVGCCYNLLTERLGPASYKLPELRPTTHSHPRLRTSGSKINGGTGCEDGMHCGDPAGFPMSQHFTAAFSDHGIRLNITARMMAVQAPQNWGPKDSENFFTRHFYRALLQRVFLDYGVVGKPSKECVGGTPASVSTGPNVSPAGHTSEVLTGRELGGRPFGTPITIGSLRKGCYENFVTYFRGAYDKLVNPPPDADHASQDLTALIQSKLSGLSDVDLEAYEADYLPRKKELSIIWSLMAFSAGVIEAAIVVDRWLWLREQEVVGECWVESCFDYRVSPRNLVVVGVKKGGG